MILSSSSSPSIIWIIPNLPNNTIETNQIYIHSLILLRILFLLNIFYPTNNSSFNECQGWYFLTAENENIKRVSIACHCLWNEAVVGRIMHRCVQDSIELNQSRTIDFEFCTRSFRDFNQSCHVLRCVATRRDVVSRVCPKAFFRHKIHFDQATFLFLIVWGTFFSRSSWALSSNVNDNSRRICWRCLSAFCCGWVSWSRAFTFISLSSKDYWE